GGHLAEVRSAADLSTLRGALVGRDQNAYWVGGQAAYKYASPFCSLATGDALTQCAQKAAVYYRWLTDDAEFATATGPGVPTIGASTALSLSDVNLSLQLPGEGG